MDAYGTIFGEVIIYQEKKPRQSPGDIKYFTKLKSSFKTHSN